MLPTRYVAQSLYVHLRYLAYFQLPEQCVLSPHVAHHTLWETSEEGMFQMEPDVYRKRRKRCALDGAIWDERLKPESHADLAWAQGKVATKGKAKAGNGATKGKAKAGNGAAKGKANARDYSGKSAAASADAASPDPAKGKPRRTPSLIREHTYERAMFEAACFERYGVKVWARVILAGGTIHRTHIHAVNTEIKMRIREGEGRDATEIDTELHPAVGSRNVGRIGIPPC